MQVTHEPKRTEISQRSAWSKVPAVFAATMSGFGGRRGIITRHEDVGLPEIPSPAGHGPRTLSLALALGLIGIAVAGCATNQAASERSDYTRLMQLAGDIDRRGNPEMAASMYARAAETSKDNPDAYVKLGDARLAAGQLSAAAQAYRGALRRQQDYPPALLGLGKTRLQLGQTHYAAKVLGQAAPVINSVDAWSQLGAARAMLGQTRKAQAAFREANRLSNSVDVQSNLALADALAGDYIQAVSRMRTVCDSPLAETRHFRNLLLVLVLAGRDTQAYSTHFPGIGPAQQKALYTRARRIRDMAQPGRRARAIGMVASPVATRAADSLVSSEQGPRV